MSVIKIGRTGYTAWLAWFVDCEDKTAANLLEAEEMDFTAIFKTTSEIVDHAHALATQDYEPGFEVVGIVDNHTNTVLYNPYNFGTRTTL